MIRQLPWATCGEIDDLGLFICPRCRKPFKIGPLFDHHITNCQGCSAPLAEWNLMSKIYLIDAERAPIAVRAIIRFLNDLGEPQAEDEVKELHRLFGVDLGY